VLSFLLEKKIFSHEFSNSINLRTLIFNAKIHDFDELYIVGGNILEKGIVRIIENPVNDTVNKTTIRYIPSYSGEAHSFQVNAYIPQNTFNLLLNYDETIYSITLLLELDMIDGNIQFSSTPDEINWNIETQKFEIADSITLEIVKKIS